MVICVVCIWGSLGDAKEGDGRLCLLERLLGQYPNSLTWIATLHCILAKGLRDLSFRLSIFSCTLCGSFIF